MPKLILISLFLGNLQVTSYRSVENQTDSSPFYTSTGERVKTGGAAISQDLLCGACKKLHKRCAHPEYPKRIHYGDHLYIKNVGLVTINDCMGKVKTYKLPTLNGYKKVFRRQLKAIDVWVARKENEKAFHRKYGINKHKVWLVNLEENNK